MRKILTKPIVIGLGIVALVAIGFVVVGPHDGPAATTSAPSAVAAAPQGPAGLTPPDGTFTDVVPTDTTWTLQNSIAVPVSRTAGPTRISPEGIGSGFSHDPAGALLAAANYAAGTAQRFTAPGPATTALIDQRVLPWQGQSQDKAQAIAAASQPSETPVVLQIAGYRFLSYDGDHATLLITQRVTSPANAPRAGYTPWIQLAWVDGDWWVIPAVDGHGEVGIPWGWPLSPEMTAWAGVA